jgi:hypothetical protein
VQLAEQTSRMKRAAPSGKPLFDILAMPTLVLLPR